ncbi:RND family efflux transporter MFP subunit [Rhodovulum bhavnagarense]|uniref:RND family efflux transporter MFP subunit n=1 Tax=Rhodovulum bhavnagarense TaxID=992286 RepID=A0A4R2RF35_9RHOB|nr:efflux RND transporter periplasmic adaptor subunit [Rhodovulum bhavnagarense]TCP60899.1 RND family efflux transporter MFP subunit [Rhodovulum bhavnagarense]
MRLKPFIGFLVPVALGVVLAAGLLSRAEPPARSAMAERSAAVRTLIVAERPIRPVARGYGTVTPSRTWAAVAEVAGSVVWRSPELETGTLIRAGQVVLRLDPTAYELALAQAEADGAVLRADLAQLEAEATNTGRLLDIERRRLRLAEAEFRRVRALVDQGNAPDAQADAQERTLLQIERGVQELSNALELIPARRARLSAQMARADAVLARARRDLEKTEITAPFDLRVAEVAVEQDQFAAMGQPLLQGDGVAAAEVTARIPLDSFPRLLGGARADGTGGLALLERADFRAAIAAEVRLVGAPGQVWSGQVTRVGNALDPRTRTVPVTIEVADPYAGANPPDRLALVPNMYVEVVLTGASGAAQIAIPDPAVQAGGVVYLRDAEGRLALREVTVAFRQDGQAIIADGLAPGDEVVLDDLVPAIPGMRLIPVEAGQ